jgi:hypothetical protein
MGRENLPLRTVMNADGAAILDTQSGTISTLNVTGAKIWLALQRGDGLEAIAAELVCETGEQIGTVKRDVQDFIDGLKKQKLLPS